MAQEEGANLICPPAIEPWLLAYAAFGVVCALIDRFPAAAAENAVNNIVHAVLAVADAPGDSSSASSRW
jgi:hypothetical protein